MRKFLASAAIVFALTGTAQAQDFQKGLTAYRAGDYSTALKEWRPLAQQGDVNVQFNLGLMYRRGQGVPQDNKEAAKWYRKASDQGIASAQNNLGYMYYSGEGVPQDYKESMKWYRKAAEQGYARAQLNLGLMYDYGEGVPQDRLLAHMWCNISSANGYKIAGQHRERIAERMTREAIEEAQAMARECMSSNYQNCVQ